MSAGGGYEFGCENSHPRSTHSQRKFCIQRRRCPSSSQFIADLVQPAGFVASRSIREFASGKEFPSLHHPAAALHHQLQSQTPCGRALWAWLGRCGVAKIPGQETHASLVLANETKRARAGDLWAGQLVSLTTGVGVSAGWGAFRAGCELERRAYDSTSRLSKPPPPSRALEKHGWGTGATRDSSKQDR